MKKSLFFTLLLVLYTSQLWAQSADVSLNLLGVVPQGQFKENVKNSGFGIAGAFQYNFEDTPFGLGLNLGYAQYGNESRRENIVPGVEVDVVTANNIFFMHVVGQVYEDFGFIRPYAEGLFGFNSLWTDTEVNDFERDDEESEIASNTHLFDMAASYGVGGGLQIRLNDFDFDDYEHGEARYATLYLDLKVRYMFGGEADYLREGDIDLDANDKVVFNKSHSETDFMTYHIGVVFNIR